MIRKIIITGVLAGTAALGVAACHSPGTDGTAPVTSTSPSPAAAHAAATPAPPLTGPAGTTFSDTETQNSGASAEMYVTMTGITDPAQPTAYETPDPGTRYVGAQFTLKGVSGTFSDDADIYATVTGSNDQSYTPDFDSLQGCTDFSNGSFTVSPGQVSVGCVTFEVPDGVTVRAVSWQAPFSSGQPATWEIS